MEVVREMWAAYTRGDFDASLGMYAEDTAWDDTHYRPDGAVRVGRQAVFNLARTWHEAWEWESYEVEVEQLHEAEDGRVAVVLNADSDVEGRSRGRPSSF